MTLPPTLYNELKIPLGVLVPEKRADSVTISAHIVGAPYVITVGDRTTEKLIGFGIVPNLQIVDGQEKRAHREQPSLPDGTILESCSNPASCITGDSIAKIKKAFLSQSSVRLVVDGEEDLLVIPACIYAPKNAVVLYGQPNEGMVIVHIDEGIRRKTQRLLDLINQGNDETVAV